MAGITQQFFEECEEHLALLESGFLRLEAGDHDPETVNSVFRAAHSIKGGAAMLGATALVGFSHRFESALAHFRTSKTFPSHDVLKVFLKATDQLADLVRATRAGKELTDEQLNAASRELAGLADTTGTDTSPVAHTEEPAFSPVRVEFEDFAPAEQPWTIDFRPHAELYAKANDPIVLLRELKRLGEMDTVLDTSAIPLLSDLNLEDAYLAWSITLHTARTESAVREVFEFVERDCDLHVRAGIAETAIPPAADPRPVPAPALRPGDASQDAPALRAALQQPSTLRVDLERLDRLINLVSELVISEAALAEYAPKDSAQNPNFGEALDDLSQLTRDIQESVMGIRAQPVKSVFQRLPRLVREIEKATGKTVRLTIEGEDTQVDRSVIEGLTDPLTHMVRNAIDHGIETYEQRQKANKPAQGSLRISAAHRAGRVVIEVADDGGGIDRDCVRAIAVKQNLISADAIVAGEDIDNLIFEPGFTTADKVTDLSGRGVGMDVVRRSVQALGGRISVSSRRGAGTTFALSLPLTLAVLDGMLVSVCGQSLVVPLAALLETVQFSCDNVHKVGPNASLLAIRGSHVPLIDLGATLGYKPQSQLSADGIALLVEDDAGRRVALAVDDILGQKQVVIKSLEINCHRIAGIAAATILGNGLVALILDVNAVMASQKIGLAQDERLMAHA
ncbi:MAG: chemotaxis protein CheA [Proteobacteria bacterium]|nr:chemotaxis protein CheA [Pseudomonadota bacterium]